MPKKELSEKELRARALHGWAFRKWTAEEELAIRAFLNLETNKCPEAYTASWNFVSSRWRT